jgi:hypothetical protein
MSLLFPSRDELPDDIAEEEALYEELRREPGLLKRAGRAPNLLVITWKTPGHFANLVLLVLYYILCMAVCLWSLGPEGVRRIPGIFQCGILALLVLPAALLSSWTWRLAGPGPRAVIRWLIRLWPLSLPAFLYIAVLAKLALLSHGKG